MLIPMYLVDSPYHFHKRGLSNLCPGVEKTFQEIMLLYYWTNIDNALA